MVSNCPWPKIPIAIRSLLIASPTGSSMYDWGGEPFGDACDSLPNWCVKISQCENLTPKPEHLNILSSPKRWPWISAPLPGKHPTKKSRRQVQTQARLAELFRREAVHRKALHGRLANQMLSLGVLINTAKLSYNIPFPHNSKSISSPQGVESRLGENHESGRGFGFRIQRRQTGLSRGSANKILGLLSVIFQEF